MEKVLLADMPAFAKKILERLQPAQGSATLMALSGDLGAGKTTFVQALAHELGVESAVQSPTYVLMKLYELSGQKFDALVHIDLFRLEKPEEFAALRPEEFLTQPRTLVVVEWPERAGGALPKPDLVLRFSADGTSERERYIEVV